MKKLSLVASLLLGAASAMAAPEAQCTGVEIQTPGVVGTDDGDMMYFS